MNQKTIIIILAVVAIIVMGGGGFLYFRNTSQKQVAAPTPEQSDVVSTLSPQDVGLTLRQSDSGKFAGHGVVIRMNKLDGVSTVDCEFSYIASTGTDNLPRGGICKSVQIKPGDTLVQQEYPYGTCSDVCHFDSDISAVKVVLKVTKTDGKTYQVTQSL